MTHNEIINTAKVQLLRDFSCTEADFAAKDTIINKNIPFEGRRIYKSDGCFVKILCFMGKIIVSCDENMIPFFENWLRGKTSAWLFQYDKLKELERELNKHGHTIADIHEYYLPTGNADTKPMNYALRWFDQQSIFQFETDDRITESFAFDKNHPDMIAVGAYDGENLMGMAGASCDGEDLWQIGIDVFPPYKGRGIGSNLTRELKEAILAKNKVPFYGTVQSHMISKSVAIKAGFMPAWSELYTMKLKP